MFVYPPTKQFQKKRPKALLKKRNRTIFVLSDFDFLKNCMSQKKQISWTKPLDQEPSCHYNGIRPPDAIIQLFYSSDGYTLSKPAIPANDLFLFFYAKWHWWVGFNLKFKDSLNVTIVRKKEDTLEKSQKKPRERTAYDRKKEKK
jgi:hypothetical protein